MINLGQKAKDKITGFEGILIARATYLTGCDQYGITPKAVDGKINETQWFDEGRIQVVGKGINKEKVKSNDNGGPNRDCPK